MNLWIETADDVEQFRNSGGKYELRHAGRKWSGVAFRKLTDGRVALLGIVRMWGKKYYSDGVNAYPTSAECITANGLTRAA